MISFRADALGLFLSVCGVPAIAQTNVVDSMSTFETTSQSAYTAVFVQGYYGPGTPGGGWYVRLTGTCSVDHGYCDKDGSGAYYWTLSGFSRHPSLLDYGLTNSTPATCTGIIVVCNANAFTNIQSAIGTLGVTQFYGDGLHLQGTGVDWELKPGLSLDMGYPGDEPKANSTSFPTMAGAIEVDSANGHTFKADANAIVHHTAFLQAGSFLSNLNTAPAGYTGLTGNMIADSLMAGAIFTPNGQGAGLEDSIIVGGQNGYYNNNTSNSMRLKNVGIVSNQCVLSNSVNQWPYTDNVRCDYFALNGAMTTESWYISSIVNDGSNHCEVVLQSGQTDITTVMQNGFPIEMPIYPNLGGRCGGQFWGGTAGTNGVELVNSTTFIIENSTITAPTGVTAWFDKSSNALNVNACLRPGESISDASGNNYIGTQVIAAATPCPQNNPDVTMIGTITPKVQIAIATTGAVTSGSPESVTITEPALPSGCTGASCPQVVLQANYLPGPGFTFANSQGYTGPTFHSNNRAINYYFSSGTWTDGANWTTEGNSGNGSPDYDSACVWFDGTTSDTALAAIADHGCGWAVLQTTTGFNDHNEISASQLGGVIGVVDQEAGDLELDSGTIAAGTSFLDANIDHFALHSLRNVEQTFLVATESVLPNVTCDGGPIKNVSAFSCPWGNVSAPTASALGGAFASTCTTGQYVDALSTAGVLGCGQPVSTSFLSESCTPFQASGTTEYWSMGGCTASTTESAVAVAVPPQITFRNLYAYVSTQPGAGNSVTFTWRINGASPPGGPKCTISATATSCSDLVGVAVNSAGQTSDMQVAFSASAATAKIGWSVETLAP